jgi:hypothetical protein
VLFTLHWQSDCCASETRCSWVECGEPLRLVDRALPLADLTTSRFPMLSGRIYHCGWAVDMDMRCGNPRPLQYVLSPVCFAHSVHGSRAF